jgi:hypothetical protein
MPSKKSMLLLLHLISMVLLGLGLYKEMLQIDISAHFIIELKLFKRKPEYYWGAAFFMAIGQLFSLVTDPDVWYYCSTGKIPGDLLFTICQKSRILFLQFHPCY